MYSNQQQLNRIKLEKKENSTLNDIRCWCQCHVRYTNNCDCCPYSVIDLIKSLLRSSFKNTVLLECSSLKFDCFFFFCSIPSSLFLPICYALRMHIIVYDSHILCILTVVLVIWVIRLRKSSVHNKICLRKKYTYFIFIIDFMPREFFLSS